MTDDAGLKLLAAVEALHAEIRAMREEASEERNATKTLREQRARKAARQKEWRADQKAEMERNVSVDTTRSVSVATTPQVVKAKDLDQEQEQDLKPAALRNGDATIVTPLLEPKATGSVWKAYSTAYFERYSTEPVRNAKVNGQITQLVKRLGGEAAEVAAFYVRHRGAFYTQKGHAVGPLLADAEKLRMEWVTDRQITGTEARQQEQTQTHLQQWQQLSRRKKNGLV